MVCRRRYLLRNSFDHLRKVNQLPPKKLSLILFLSLFSHFYLPASGQAVVTGVVPSSPRFLPSIFIAHRVQQSHCSSIFHRVLLTHALALSASQFEHEKKSPRICTSMHSAGLELTKLTYARLEDNLIRHRGDRLHIVVRVRMSVITTTNTHVFHYRSFARSLAVALVTTLDT